MPGIRAAVVNQLTRGGHWAASQVLIAIRLPISGGLCFFNHQDIYSPVLRAITLNECLHSDENYRGILKSHHTYYYYEISMFRKRSLKEATPLRSYMLCTCTRIVHVCSYYCSSSHPMTLQCQQNLSIDLENNLWKQYTKLLPMSSIPVQCLVILASLLGFSIEYR